MAMISLLNHCHDAAIKLENRNLCASREQSQACLNYAEAKPEISLIEITQNCKKNHEER